MTNSAIEAMKRPSKSVLAKSKKQGPMDLPFLLLVLLIMCFGLIMMFSASYASAYYTKDNSAYFFIKQGLIGAAGTVVMLLISPYQFTSWMRALSIPRLIISVVLLALVPFIAIRRAARRR